MSQWMSLAKSLPIVVPQWGTPSNVMTHCDVINESWNIKVVSTGVIFTRDQGYEDHVKTSHSVE